MRVGLPDSGTLRSAVRSDGMQVFRSEVAASSIVVNPMEAGVQIAVVIGDSSAPTSYKFPLSGPVGSVVELGADGTAGVVSPEGETIASVEAPWARDATGRQVDTEFVVQNGALVQRVAHDEVGVVYPVVADPKIFRCDLNASICVKFTKKETKDIYNKGKDAGRFTAAAVAFLCSKIPHIVIAAGCVGTVAAAGPALYVLFKSAAGSGKCVELHFLVPSGLLWKWKKESC